MPRWPAFAIDDEVESFCSRFCGPRTILLPANRWLRIRIAQHGYPGVRLKCALLCHQHSDICQFFGRWIEINRSIGQEQRSFCEQQIHAAIFSPFFRTMTWMAANGIG